MKKFLSLLSFFVITSSVPFIMENSIVTSINEKSDFNFRFVNNHLTNLNYENDIIFDHITGNIYLVGDGLYKSTDGINFVKEQTNLPLNSQINSLTITENNSFYVATNTGLYVSNNGDSNFVNIDYMTNIFNQTPSNGIISKLESWDNKLYALVNGSIYLLENSNNNFYFVKIVNFNNIIDFVFDKNGSVYFLISSNSNLNLLFLNNSNNTYSIKNTFINGEVNNLFLNDNSLFLNVNNNILMSTDFGKTFTTVDTINQQVNKFVIVDNIIYFLNEKKQLVVNNSFNKLINIENTKNFNNQNNTFIFNKLTSFSLNTNYIANATFNNQKISDLDQKINLLSGINKLVINLKSQYASDTSFFNSNKASNQIIYTFDVKNQIDSNDILYKSTDVFYTNLVSNAGNTFANNIIQTKKSDLSVAINNINVDVNSSYYVSGTVDDSNNFLASSNKVYLKDVLVNNEFTIDNTGIYQLFIKDNSNDTYTSNLEIGANQWKLKGTFNDNQDAVNTLATQLNVKLDLNDGSKNTQIIASLSDLKLTADNFFQHYLKMNFPKLKVNLLLSDLPHGYKNLLDNINYTNLKRVPFTNYYNDFDIIKFDNLFNNYYNTNVQVKAKEIAMQATLVNVDTINVVSEFSLVQFNSWVKNFYSYYSNLDTLLKTVANKDFYSLLKGYGGKIEISALEKIITNFFLGQTGFTKSKVSISSFYNSLVWSEGMSDNYSSLINFDLVNTVVKDIINKNSPDLLTAYNKDLLKAESNLNLHGYKLSQIIGNNKLPQNKIEVEQNYDNSGKSFHEWLQTQANSKFHKWQMDTSLEVIIPFIVVLGICAFIFVLYHYEIYGACGMRKKLKPRKIKRIKRISFDF